MDSVIQLAEADQPSEVKSVRSYLLSTDLFTDFKDINVHSPFSISVYSISFFWLQMFQFKLYENCFLKFFFETFLSKDRSCVLITNSSFLYLVELLHSKLKFNVTGTENMHGTSTLSHRTSLVYSPFSFFTNT